MSNRFLQILPRLQLRSIAGAGILPLSKIEVNLIEQLRYVFHTEPLIVRESQTEEVSKAH